MEYFDVLDGKRNFMNKVLPRGTKLNLGEFNQGCEVYIILHNNSILITQRCELKSHPLMWEVPGGCTVSGETTLDTAVREINEEVGLNIDRNQFKLIGTEMYKSQFVDIYMVKLDKINIADLKLQPEEVKQAKVVSFAKLEEMIKNNQIVTCTKNDYLSIKTKLI